VRHIINDVSSSRVLADALVVIRGCVYVIIYFNESF
jgi:hypothetical protein